MKRSVPRAVAGPVWVLVASLTIGCGGASAKEQRLMQAILGGELAPEASAVVEIINFAGGQCSGSVIGPKLVLTARHCIADTVVDDRKVRCGETTFTVADSAGAVFVLALPETSDDPADYLAVSAIRLPDAADADLCGTDVALLVLKEPLAGVAPLVPRVDLEAQAGESYSAVGYGVDESQAGRPSGVRKRLEGLVVDCAGKQCELPDVQDNEWVGSGGPCSGDSGGPALDREGRVIGVVSRGKDPCREPVFSSVAARADWLKAEALELTSRTPAQRPNWALGYSSDPRFHAPIGGECGGPEDCESGQCGLDRRCTRPCAEDGPCPADYQCDAETRACVATPEELGTSCSFSPRPTSDSEKCGWALGCLLCLSVRRRRCVSALSTRWRPVKSS